eukprot:444760_1
MIWVEYEWRYRSHTVYCFKILFAFNLGIEIVFQWNFHHSHCKTATFVWSLNNIILSFINRIIVYCIMWILYIIWNISIAIYSNIECKDDILLIFTSTVPSAPIDTTENKIHAYGYLKMIILQHCNTP